MNKRLSVFSSLLLLAPIAQADELCAPLQHAGVTVADATARQMAKSVRAMVIPDKMESKCHPQEKMSMMIGWPVCQLVFGNAAIPVSAMIIGSRKDGVHVDGVHYMMRGTKEDFNAAFSYYNEQYPDATNEYMNELQGYQYYGTTHAWKNGEQYIVLGRHEPGYSPPEASLFLTIGSKEAMKSENENDCK